MRENRSSQMFDYQQLTPELAERARTAATRVRDFMRASVVEVGRELLRVKEELEHGQFIAWVQSECHLGVRTAERLIRAAEFAAKYDNLSYLPMDGLLAFASRSTPEA